jgi:hypothetical protein
LTEIGCCQNFEEHDNLYIPVNPTVFPQVMIMFKSIEGVYCNGKIELLETLNNVEKAKVIVTFMPTKGTVHLNDRGLDEAHALNLRTRLKAFAEDWQCQEMDVYDDL